MTNYADTLHVHASADEAYISAVAAHIAHPTGPVLVSGPPGCAKVYVITQEARAAGLSCVHVHLDVLRSGDFAHVRRQVADAPGKVILILDGEIRRDCFELSEEPVKTQLQAELDILERGVGIHQSFHVRTERTRAAI